MNEEALSSAIKIQSSIVLLCSFCPPSLVDWILSVFRGFAARQQVRVMKMSQDDKCKAAAVTLQKYFRMWKAQARLISLQLALINGSNSIVPVADTVWTHAPCS
jgi:hypothetical protein